MLPMEPQFEPSEQVIDQVTAVLLVALPVTVGPSELLRTVDIQRYAGRRDSRDGYRSRLTVAIAILLLSALAVALTVAVLAAAMVAGAV